MNKCRLFYSVPSEHNIHHHKEKMSLFSDVFLNTSKKNNKFDGPYVFYRDDGVEVRMVEENRCVVVTGSREPLLVRFSNHPEWNFTLTLKNKLSCEPCRFDKAQKIFVLSDMEGEFAALRRLLLSNGIIDENYNWLFGIGHLVVNGDLFDRGDEVTALLWLIYKLEDDAKRHGGYVHTIIGNHDVMNLSGDLRYVDEKYFTHAALMDMDYMKLFDEHTEIGRWLRTKNVMEKIGDRLFVHGGVSPALNDLQLRIEDINDKCRAYYDKTENKEEPALQPLFNRQALYWYRGYFTQPRATMRDVDNTLRLYGCVQIIVGHTILADRNPALYYEGKVLGIDVNQHKGVHAAVLIEDDSCFVVNDKGNKMKLVYRPQNDMIDPGKLE